MPEYILKRDGRVFRRPVELQVEGETELDIDTAILSQIKTNIVRSVKSLSTIDGHTVGFCSVTDSSAYLNVVLPALPLNCTIRSNGEFAIPSFEPKGDFINVQWATPADMSLIFAAMIQRDSDDEYFCEYCYLFAIDRNKIAYVLPLPNLYNDAHICTGQTCYSGETLLECFERTYVGVRDSRWNNHLIHDRGMFDNSQKLFRFKATKEGFETVASDIHWTKLSSKVGTDVLNYLTL